MMTLTCTNMKNYSTHFFCCSSKVLSVDSASFLYDLILGMNQPRCCAFFQILYWGPVGRRILVKLLAVSIIENKVETMP